MMHFHFYITNPFPFFTWEDIISYFYTYKVFKNKFIDIRLDIATNELIGLNINLSFKHHNTILNFSFSFLTIRLDFNFYDIRYGDD
jgi:hypothetical protein